MNKVRKSIYPDKSCRQGKLGIAALLFMLLSVSVSRATVYTVVNTSIQFFDIGSLAWAIDQVNAGSGGDTINFNLPGGGPYRILRGSYTIQKSVTIDGTTQSGYSGTPVVEIGNRGTYSGDLTVSANNCHFIGLSIVSQSRGIYILSDSNSVTRCYIGIDAAEARFGNASGIVISGSDNMIGGVGEGNVISGNNDGIAIQQGGKRNRIQGNIIGLNHAGTTAIANTVRGIAINSGQNIVGGTTAGERNIISSNQIGIFVADTANVIIGNYIGTDITGTAALGNQTGVALNGFKTVLGGAATGEGNLISGNTGNGVHGYMRYSVTDNKDTILGNIIGLNAAGTAAIPNIGYGLRNDGAGAIIGGSGTGERNYISGNGIDGVYITGASNAIKGNYIGTDITGTVAIGNAGYGLNVGTPFLGGAEVGGTGTGEGNLVSGNGSGGMLIAGGPNVVTGNIVGLDKTGTIALPNTTYGIRSQGSSIIGSSVAGGGNIISGNNGGGIITEFGGPTIKGNYIGLNKAGTAAIPNTTYGINVTSSGTVIGGIGANDGNVISGNIKSGIYVSGAPTMTIKGNIIGLNAAGDTGIGNGEYGIEMVSSQNDTIGVANGGNIISGNTLQGIYFSNFSGGCAIMGNYIGLNKAGTAAIGNGKDGIKITANVTVGGSSAGQGNVIAGNNGRGITISNNVLMDVKGNIIGMDAAGTIALPNASYGIYSDNGTVVIGSNGAGNYISGNDSGGVYLKSNMGYNKLTGNYIGVNKAGTAAVPNQGTGATVLANYTQIGGTNAGDGNIISGNTADGLVVNGTNNTLTGNIIGMNSAATAAVPNGGNGITISGTLCVAGGTAEGSANIIAGNTGSGIAVTGPSSQVRITRNSIYDNGRLGIDLNNDGITLNDSMDADSGPNTMLNTPVITSIVQSDGNTIVKGTFTGAVYSSYTVEFFNNTAPDASGFGEGKIYVDDVSVNLDNTGHGTFTKTLTGSYSVISATATLSFPLHTSEFSPTGVSFATATTPTLTICQGSAETDVKPHLYASDLMLNQTLTWSQSLAPMHGILTISSATATSGTIAIAPGGTIAYQPAAGYSGQDSFKIQVTDGAGTATKTIYVMVNSIPDITSISNNGPACAGATLNLSSTISGGGSPLTYSWSGPNSFTSTLQNPSLVSADADASGMYTLIVADDNSCADTNTTTAVIYSTPVISVATNNGPLCANNTLSLTSTATDGTGSLTYTWSGPSAYSGTGKDKNIFSAQVAASGTYTLIVTDDNNCADTATTEAIVYPTPVINTISNNAPVCEEKILSLSSGVSGGSGLYNYIWSGPNDFTAEDANPQVTASATVAADGSYTLIVMDENHCSDTASTSVTVYPRQPIVGENSVIFGQTITLSNPVAGGSWSTATPWTTKVTSGNGDVKGVSAGISAVTYTTSDGCTSTHTVTVISSVNACVGQTITISDGLTTGGTWTSSSNSIATVGINTGIITGVLAGNVVITHKLASGATATTNVKVNPLAPISTAATSGCQGQAIILTNATAGGGTWYSGNTSMAVISPTGSLTGIAGGDVVIYFTPVAGCVTTKTVTINAVTAITGPTSVCVSQTITLTNATGGGTWSTSNGSMATVFNGVVGGVSANTPIITYKWPNGCYATAAITVKALSQIVMTTTILCQNATTTLSNATTGGGTWSSDNKFSVNGSGVATAINAGAGIIYFNANNGCVTSKTATVNPSPAISGIPGVCVGQTTLLSSSITGGTWSTTNGSQATVYNGIVGGVGAGTPNISYKMPSGCFGFAAVTVKALSPISGGSTSICPAGTTAYTNATAGGGVWSSSVPSVATVSGNVLVTGAGAAAGSKTVISFTSTANGCVATRTVTIVSCRDGGNTTQAETIATPAVFNVQLYPNPNNGIFTLKGTIDMAAGEEANIEIVNMLGQVIYRSKASIQNGNIDEQVQLQGNLASGTYYLNLRTGSGNKLFHFVVGQ